MSGRKLTVLVASVATILSTAAIIAPAADAKPKAKPPAKVTKARVAAASRNAATITWTNPKSKNFKSTVVRIATGTRAPGSVKAGRAVATVSKKKHAVAVTRLAAGTTYTVGLFTTDGKKHFSKGVAVRIRTLPTPPVVTPKPPVVTQPPVVTPPAPAPKGTWRTPALALPASGGISSISCPTTSFCMAVDYNGASAARSAGQWKPVVAADLPVAGQTEGPELRSVSCVDANFCVATSRRNHVVTWNGTKWAVSDNLGTEFRSVSCASRSLCFAVATSDSTDDSLWRFDGTSWSYDASFDYEPREVTCASPTWCAARTTDGVAVWDGGWHDPSKPSGFDGYIAAIACPQASSCIAADSDGNSRSFVGGSWGTPKPIGSFEDDYVATFACSATNNCFAGDGTVTYKYNGSQWSAAVPGAGSGLARVRDVFCGAGACLATDGEKVGSVDAAGFGPATTVDAYRGIANQVECAGTSLCVAGSQLGQVAETAGSTWTVVQTPLAGSIEGVSCPTVTFCLAVDSNGDAASRSESGTWTKVAGLSGDVGFAAVSCSSSTFCMGVDVDRKVWRFDGAAWSDANLTADGDFTVDISCSSSAFCALSADADVYIYSDGTWKKTTQPTSDETPVSSISCPVDGTCFAAANDSHVYRLSGSAWTQSAELLSYGNYYGYDIDCASSTFCVVSTGGYNGDNDAVRDGVWTYDGSSWSDIEELDLQPTRISCGASNFCAAADEHGYLITYN